MVPLGSMVTRTSRRTETGRRTYATTSAVLAEIDRLRRDAGMSLSALARAADVDQGYLSHLLAGVGQPSLAVLTALATVLGADLSVRVYPSTGPTVRDRIQARITEELLRVAAPAWRRSVEVAVHRPARGYIDIVFDDPGRAVAVCSEVQSRLDRLEQQIRWSGDKAASLPSADIWTYIEGEPIVSRLLVVRSTSATRELARRFGATLEVAYPARTTEAFRSLTSDDVRWPGPAILWADVAGDGVRILDRPPRGVEVGRRPRSTAFDREVMREAHRHRPQ